MNNYSPPRSLSWKPSLTHTFMTTIKVMIPHGCFPIKAQTLFMVSLGPFFILILRLGLFLAFWLSLGSEFHLLIPDLLMLLGCVD